MAYQFGSKHRSRSRVPRRIIVVVVLLFALFVSGAVVVHRHYTQNLLPLSSNQTTQDVTIESGSSVKQIAALLQNDKLIRSAWAFERYVRSEQLEDKLQAGTYAFSPSQSIQDIVATLTKGKVSTNLVTILPGKRIDQVRASLINDGFTPTDVDAALKPEQYTSLPVMAFKPATATTLEGLLWPDSYQKDATTTASTIVSESLMAMGEHLTLAVQQAFAAQGLTVYEGLILTSVITQEVSKPADQPIVAQVFLSRLKNGMMLGSDVTANYGSVAAGRAPDLSYDSPYNTLIHTGLPPTPISTITSNALTASTHPAATDYVYFVAGDDGTTHFSHTLQEHEAATDQYCHKLCGR
jgi:UPF0755 protein